MCTWSCTRCVQINYESTEMEGTRQTLGSTGGRLISILFSHCLSALICSLKSHCHRLKLSTSLLEQWRKKKVTTKYFISHGFNLMLIDICI